MPSEISFGEVSTRNHCRQLMHLPRCQMAGIHEEGADGDLAGRHRVGTQAGPMGRPQPRQSASQDARGGLEMDDDAW